ncbi:hypothetical protein PsorP6_006364 [Peronosclerospora sorghi]|uniref:Uncharacterized protein n=1 Tax=Peronosclerospora sorghi TaxID=230839 RepID=A0ACC0W4Q4_9STRA|nr:hypothetical protein PsorP6_006364 [Peronosclerospora sorghi]
MSLAEPSGTRRGGGGATAKAFVGQMYAALHSSLRSNPIINGVDCSRLWIQVALTFLFVLGYVLMVTVSGQGGVVSTSSNRKQCTVDDGTGCFLKNSPPGANAQPQLGTWNDTTSSYVLSEEYVMAIGPMHKVRTEVHDSMRTLLAHQVIKLDAKMQREPIWFLEVIEYWMFVARKPRAI